MPKVRSLAEDEFTGPRVLCISWFILRAGHWLRTQLFVPRDQAGRVGSVFLAVPLRWG